MHLKPAFLTGGLALAWLLLLNAIAFAAEPAKEEPAGDPSACELIIEGKHIEKLSLVNELGVQKEFNRPGSSVLLPQGSYSIQEIQVEGGYFAYPYSGNVADRLTLTPNAPCKLRAGAPLTSGVTVKRAGRLLKLDYILSDADGRKYINTIRSTTPQFSIYQGEQKIASGSFEYG